MAQVKVYGIRERLGAVRETLSDIIHMCLTEAWGIPEQKRFQRFIGLDKADFIFPADRSEHYTIVEIMMFEGRSEEAKKNLIRLLYEGAGACGLTENDLEIVLIEMPRGNWGIRGKSGDELALSYAVDI
ncbi:MULTISPECIES: tautomerase family protein [Cohnella]|uniref:tautomerase family protein n=1 Tax=Cohnella TaxID=329857 RepID=UPI0009B9A405|nr:MULTISPECIES: tautomerase family protein [Cohnella]MBN2982592.1 tautomerase family protein [Cohnella algarum]